MDDSCQGSEAQLKHQFEFENQVKKGPLEQLCSSNQLLTTRERERDRE